jgi:hypothetical protein
MWNEIVGDVRRAAGASGTVTLPKGAHVIAITAHCTSAGTLAMWDGITTGGTVTIPIPASSWFVYDPKHLSTTVNAATNYSLVFTTTDSYFVEYVVPSGT